MTTDLTGATAGGGGTLSGGDTLSSLPVPDRDALVGTTVDGRYEVLSRLGGGGMGSVYKVRHKVSGKVQALKVVNPDRATNPTARARFLREANAATELVHPNAIPVRELGATPDGLLYMTMDFSPGRSLRAVIESTGRLAPARACELVRQCLGALAAAHERGIVHRDVKPENVLVEEGPGGREVARVCDFGIAKLADGDDEAPSLTGRSAIGTPHYMSPEQASGEPAGPRADVYAVGCVLYECLTGKPPFAGATLSQVLLKQVTVAPERIETRLPSVDPALAALVHRALSKPADQRPAADELARELEAFTGTGPPRAPATPVPAPAPAMAPPAPALADPDARAREWTLALVSAGASSALLAEAVLLVPHAQIYRDAQPMLGAAIATLPPLARILAGLFRLQGGRLSIFTLGLGATLAGLVGYLLDENAPQARGAPLAWFMGSAFGLLAAGLVLLVDLGLRHTSVPARLVRGRPGVLAALGFAWAAAFDLTWFFVVQGMRDSAVDARTVVVCFAFFCIEIVLGALAVGLFSLARRATRAILG